MSVTDPATPGTAERVAYLMARPVLAVGELAEIADLSTSTVRRAIDAGDLPVRRIGRRVLIPATDARAWLGIDSTEDGAA